MIDDADGLRITRYIAGECSGQEAEEIRQWIAQDPGRRELAHAVSRVWAATRASPAGWNADEAWRQLAAARAARQVRPLMTPAVGRSDGPAVRASRVPPFRRSAVPSFRLSASIAAALLLTTSAGTFWYLVAHRHDRGQAAAQPVAAEPMREVVTRRGERAVFNLTDGSRVVLAAESRLRIPANYNTVSAGGRPLFLEGEAYFQVLHDSTRPFRVHTANGIAEDLGTEFVVTAYPETRGMRVAVASGAVGLRSPLPGPAGSPSPASADTAPLLTLAPGDLARIDTAGVATLTRGADIRPYLAWTEGTLVFDGTLLGDALPQIGRWYDLDIRLTDPALADRRLTATFTNEAAPQVLDRIALALDLKIKRDGQTVTLVGRRR